MKECLAHQRYIPLLLLLALMLAILAPRPLVAEERSYILGVFPYLPPRELEKIYGPISADLSRATGQTIVMRTNTSYAKFRRNIDKEKFDIAFLQPFDYIRSADRYGYRPLATRGEKLSAVFVVKPGSKIRRLEDFHGKNIALPPASAAVSILAIQYLKAHGMKPGKDVFITHHRSHVSCMQQVMIGEADICGTAAPAMRFFIHKMKQKLVVVGQSMEIPHTLFAVHPRVPEELQVRLRKRILNWQNSEQGRQLLKHGNMTPFVEVRDADYDIVRKLADR